MINGYYLTTLVTDFKDTSECGIMHFDEIEHVQKEGRIIFLTNKNVS